MRRSLKKKKRPDIGSVWTYRWSKTNIVVILARWPSHSPKEIVILQIKDGASKVYRANIDNFCKFSSYYSRIE